MTPPLTTNYYSYYSGFAADDLEEYVRDSQAVGCFPTHDGLTLIAVLWPSSRFEEIRADLEGHVRNGWARLRWDLLQQRVGFFGATVYDAREDLEKKLRRTLSSETASFGHRSFSSSQPEEHSESFPHVGEDLNGGGRGEFHAPSVPIQILDVIRQDDACYLAVVGQSNLERIAFRVTSDRARDRKARFRVVRAR